MRDWKLAINKKQWHIDHMCRFLPIGYRNYSPDTNQAFTDDECYLDVECGNCSLKSWYPGKLVAVNKYNCCKVCNRYVYHDRYGDDFTVGQVGLERLRAERICDEQDGVDD